MSEGKTLKEIALELLEKYRLSETGLIWEMSGSIGEDTTKLEHKCNYIRMQIERMAEPKWIPVSERLPIDFLDRRIFVSTVSPTGRRSVDIGLWEGGKWTTYFPIGDDRVTAWMPLPEPYRGDADE